MTIILNNIFFKNNRPKHNESFAVLEGEFFYSSTYLKDINSFQTNLWWRHVSF